MHNSAIYYTEHNQRCHGLCTIYYHHNVYIEEDAWRVHTHRPIVCQNYPVLYRISDQSETYGAGNRVLVVRYLGSTLISPLQAVRLGLIYQPRHKACNCAFCYVCRYSSNCDCATLEVDPLVRCETCRNYISFPTRQFACLRRVREVPFLDHPYEWTQPRLVSGCLSPWVDQAWFVGKAGKASRAVRRACHLPARCPHT